MWDSSPSCDLQNQVIRSLDVPGYSNTSPTCPSVLRGSWRLLSIHSGFHSQSAVPSLLGAAFACCDAPHPSHWAFEGVAVSRLRPRLALPRVRAQVALSRASKPETKSGSVPHPGVPQQPLAWAQESGVKEGEGARVARGREREWEAGRERGRGMERW